MEAIKQLIDECLRQGVDNHGFIHYIPKEYVDHALIEYLGYIEEDRSRANRVQEKV